MVTESPPVSPSVVAAILMIQKTRVTSGTLLRAPGSDLPFIALAPTRLKPEPYFFIDYTVATALAGEPTAPGRRSGGAVSRKRERPLARSQSASSDEQPDLAEIDAELEQAMGVQRQ